MTESTVEVLPLDVDERVTLMLAYAAKRGADAEVFSSATKVDQLISQLDKDGVLRAAIAAAGAARDRAALQNAKLSALLTKVQVKHGPIDGYQVDLDRGQFVRTVPAKPAPVVPLPVATKPPSKGRRRK